MTRHTSISLLRRRTGRLVAVAAVTVALALSGCAAGTGPAAEPASPTPTPTLEPHDLAAEISATFPTTAEWLKTYSTGQWCEATTAGEPSNCGGEPWDVPGVYSNGYTLRDGVTDVTAGAVVLTISEHPSVEGAEQQLADVKALDSAFNGVFDLAPGRDGTLIAGVRGSGTLTDFERAGWSGYRLSEASEYYNTDGSIVQDLAGTNAVVLTNGTLALLVRVYWASPEPGVVDAEMDAWLDRVLGPEESE
ncbi:MAG: hypothetical protein ABWY68_00030 [Cryobacterium sp.]